MDLDKNEALVRRIKGAVAVRDHVLAGRIENILSSYTGDVKILEKFLDYFKSDDPWKAAENARLKQAIFRTKKEVKEQMESGIIPIHGISISGHKLTDQLFVMVHKYDPTVVMTSGAQTITKLMETFGTTEQYDAFTPSGKQKIAAEKKRQTYATMDELPETIEEILKDPSKIKDIRSRDVRTQLHSVLQIDKTLAGKSLKERLVMVYKVICGNTIFFDRTLKNTYLLATESGGPLSFIGKNLQQVPAEIRDIYTSLRSPHIIIPEEERREKFGALLAYIAKTVHINTDSAVGSYKKDLEFILKLPEHDEIIKKHGKPRLELVLDIFAKPEITLIEATRVFDLYDFDQVRIEINKTYFSKFKTEAENVLEKLKSLFVKDGKWRDDCYGASIPSDRLKKTIYSAALTDEDFRNTRDILRLKTLSASYQDGFFRSVSVVEFKERIDRMINSGRKLNALKGYLDQNKIIITNNEDCEKEVSEITARRDFAKKVPRGAGYELIENFEIKHGISLAELRKRLDSRYSRSDVWTNAKYKLFNSPEYFSGLYLSKTESKILNFISRAKELVPFETLRAEFEAAKGFLDSNFIRKDEPLLQYDKHTYLTTKEVKNITSLLEIKKDIEKDRKQKEVTLGIKSFPETYMKASDLGAGWLEKANFVMKHQDVPGVMRYIRSLIFPTKPLKDCYVQKLESDIISRNFEEIRQSLLTAKELAARFNNSDIPGIIPIDLKTKSYKVMISNTDFDQRESYKQSFKEVPRWKNNCWESTRSLSGMNVLDLIARVQKYNSSNEANLRIILFEHRQA
ncbi:MAG: hypothetical protein V1866_06970 [archaeon]